jgi:hypothetical protein
MTIWTNETRPAGDRTGIGEVQVSDPNGSHHTAEAALLSAAALLAVCVALLAIVAVGVIS